MTGLYRQAELKIAAFIHRRKRTDQRSYYSVWARYNNRGWILQSKQDYKKALKDYYAALEIDPAFAPSYYGRASAYSKSGNLPRAIEDAKEALRLDPETKKYDDLLFELRSKMKQ